MPGFRESTWSSGPSHAFVPSDGCHGVRPPLRCRTAPLWPAHCSRVMGITTHLLEGRRRGNRYRVSAGFASEDTISNLNAAAWRLPQAPRAPVEGAAHAPARTGGGWVPEGGCPPNFDPRALRLPRTSAGPASHSESVSCSIKRGRCLCYRVALRRQLRSGCRLWDPVFPGPETLWREVKGHTAGVRWSLDENLGLESL